jgi:DNA helicase HerA-like ATPase
MPENKVIGRVVATERKPSTAYSFHFWTEMPSNVGIGTLVAVYTERVKVYGVVVEGEGYTDLGSPLHDFIGAQGSPTTPAPTLRPELHLYTAAVLRVEPEEPLQPVPIGPVYLADDEAVIRALRMDEFAETSGVACGLYPNGENQSPVYLDWDFVLGPESAHLNISGVSGLATKTSAIEFLIGSIFHTAERRQAQLAESERQRYSVAVVCFNVKGPDLLFLDQPAQVPPDHPLADVYATKGVPPLDEAQWEMYGKMGLRCEPFSRVEYYAPYCKDDFNLNTLRTHPDLAHSVKPLSWGLKQVMEYAEVVLNRDDLDAKADALIQYIAQRVIDQKSEIGDKRLVVRNFADLHAWFDAVTEHMEQTGREQFATHHYQTIRKVKNRLLNLTTRYAGLLSNQETSHDLPWGAFRDRTIYVVDVAGLDAEAQDLVFTRVVSQLRQQLEQGKLGVKHVVVFVDELNKYAPADGRDTYLRQTLLDISERGRYLGLVLFSAQQFRSQVHKRIVGNSATSIYGRMDMDELSQPGYQGMTPAVKEKLSTLSKGQLMLRHPHFNQPIFVKFPRPNVLRGADGVAVFPPQEPQPLEEAIYQHLRGLDENVNRSQVREMVDGQDAEEAVRALHLTLQKRPEDPREYFRQSLRRKAKVTDLAPQKEPTFVPVSDPDDLDPFDSI